VRRLSYSAPEDPVQGSGALQAATRPLPSDAIAMPNGDVSAGPMPSAMQTSAPAEPIQPVKVEKTPGRNEPCWCGSGKKFKLCHGRA
jgi:preprotein translocase subunit SecA